MFQSIAYVGVSFAAIFLSLEAAWHFTTSKIQDRSIKPCFYKQIRLMNRRGSITGACAMHRTRDGFSIIRYV